MNTEPTLDSQKLPYLAVVCGDPAGIGAEITLKALQAPEVYRLCIPIAVGDARWLAQSPGFDPRTRRIERIAAVCAPHPSQTAGSVIDLGKPHPTQTANSLIDLGKPHPTQTANSVIDLGKPHPSQTANSLIDLGKPHPTQTANSLIDLGKAHPGPDVLSVIDLGNVPPTVEMGKASAAGGKATLQYLAKAFELALSGAVSGVVFAPLNKEAMMMAGLKHHDEYGYFAELCQYSGDYSVLMVGPRFSLASVSLHVPLKEVAGLVTEERVLKTIQAGYRAARAAGVAHPRIMVAGLNPHAGEHGLMGSEEETAIRPAVEAARAAGLDVSGPLPPDTTFMSARDHPYDVYVGMYHDQGRIALKLLDFGRVVTLAEGLPVFVCTPGHGTAYDIAGRGIARSENMLDAILLGARRAAF